MKRIILTGIWVIAICAAAFSYDVVLKNGKVLHGKLIQEDEEKVVLEDASGVRINIKKATIDTDKTLEANRKVEPEPVPEPTAEPEPQPEPESPRPKKPARVYTQEDVHRLRGEIPMDTGQVDYESGEVPAGEEPGEEYWRSRASELRGNLQQAEANYERLNSHCQRLKGATIQTHRVVNEKGETLNMAETTEEACQRAEDAKGLVERIRSEYESFQEQARQEVIPPGWTREE